MSEQSPKPATADAQNLARAAFVQGVTEFERGDLLAARQSFEQALRQAPGRPSVLLNLGLTQARLGEHAAAESLLEAAVAAQPDSADGWLALAHTHFALSRWERAVTSHERALAMRHRLPALSHQHLRELHLQQAQCLTRTGQHPQAAEVCRQWLAHDAQDPNAWTLLGDLQRETGQLTGAALSYRQALAAGGDAEMLGHYLSALEPQQAASAPPRRYVQGLFDEYAADFEGHLVEALHYQGHRLLIEQLPPPAAGRWERVLDLGCGTGLCGQLLRDRSAHLSGVDLSPAMVAQAAQRGIYDDLAADDLHDHLERSAGPFDLVVAADVFIYVGPLERSFALLAQRMRSDGLLAFTLEPASAGAGVQLLPSLRYAHTDAYITSLAAAHGFELVSRRTAPIRRHGEHDIDGRYVVLRRTQAG